MGSKFMLKATLDLFSHRNISNVFNIMDVYHNYIGPLSLMSKVLFLSKMLAGLSFLFGAQVVYLEVMRPFAKMALYRYVFFSFGKG
jgi:hypothetical protein